ncbi:MAG: hypothetical protein V7K95_10165 [Nostoc sp.]
MKFCILFNPGSLVRFRYAIASCRSNCQQGLTCIRAIAPMSSLP